MTHRQHLTALAMALELADVQHENACLDDWWDVAEVQRWLRAEVLRDLDAMAEEALKDEPPTIIGRKR